MNDAAAKTAAAKSATAAKNAAAAAAAAAATASRRPSDGGEGVGADAPAVESAPSEAAGTPSAAVAAAAVGRARGAAIGGSSSSCEGASSPKGEDAGDDLGEDSDQEAAMLMAVQRAMGKVQRQQSKLSQETTDSPSGNTPYKERRSSYGEQQPEVKPRARRFSRESVGIGLRRFSFGGGSGGGSAGNGSFNKGNGERSENYTRGGGTPPMSDGSVDVAMLVAALSDADVQRALAMAMKRAQRVQRSQSSSSVLGRAAGGSPAHSTGVSSPLAAPSPGLMRAVQGKRRNSLPNPVRPTDLNARAPSQYVFARDDPAPRSIGSSVGD